MAHFGTYSASQVLTAAELNARHGCTVARAANQSISNTTLTAISFDTEDQDTDGFFPASGTTVTIPTGFGGLYAITGLVQYSTTSLNSNTARIVAGGLTFDCGATAASQVQVVSVTMPLAAAATIQLSTYHTNGGALNVNARLWVHLVGG